LEKVLVTGGAGFIGSHLTESLLHRGDEVVVLDDLSTGSLDNLAAVQHHPRLEIVEGTVLDAQLVGELMDGCSTTYHLAAAVGVKWILEHPLRSLITNVKGTESVLEQAHRFRCRVVVASTSEVYGKNDRGALAEDDDRILGSSRLSRWFYSSAKAIDEAFALAYWQEHRLPVIIVRFFNTIGPRQTGRYGMVAPRFIRQALTGEPVTVYGDGTQTRCFTYVADVVQAILGLASTREALGEVFNIGQPNQISILDLANRVIELTGSASAIQLVPYSEAYGEGFEDMRRRIPDISKLTRVTGFKPSVGLDEALSRIIEYERAKLAPHTR
jgi:UDP-glucose 4-epimerase